MHNRPPTEEDTKQADKLKGLHMEHGRAKASLTRAEDALAEALAEDVNADEAQRVVDAALKVEATLAAKIKIFKQREADAALAKKADALKLEADKEEFILSQLQTVGQQVDHQMEALGETVTKELVPLLNAARTLQNATLWSQITTASLSFHARLLEGVKQMPRCNTGLGVYLKKEPWSDSLPKPKAQA